GCEQLNQQGSWRNSHYPVWVDGIFREVSHVECRNHLCCAVRGGRKHMTILMVAGHLIDQVVKVSNECFATETLLHLVDSMGSLIGIDAQLRQILPDLI